MAHFALGPTAQIGRIQSRMTRSSIAQVPIFEGAQLIPGCLLIITPPKTSWAFNARIARTSAPASLAQGLFSVPTQRSNSTKLSNIGERRSQRRP